MTSRKILLLSAGIFASLLLSVAVYVWGYMGAIVDDVPTIIAFTNYEYIHMAVWAVIATIMFACLLWVFTLKTAAGRTWLAFVIGLATWAVADLFYMVNYLLYQLEFFPSPSVAQILFVIGYVAIIIGMVFQFRIAHTRLQWWEYTIIGVIEALLLLYAIINVLIPVVQMPLSEDVNQAEKILQFIYPLCDLIVIFLSLMLAFAYRGGQFSRAWFLLAGAFIIMAIYDLFASFFNLVLNSDYFYFLTDFLYFGSYMLFAAGALLMREILQKA